MIDQIVDRFFIFCFATHKILTAQNDLVKCFGIIIFSSFTHCPRWEYQRFIVTQFLANSIDSKRSHENNWLWFVGRRWSSSSVHYIVSTWIFILNECNYMCHKLHDVRSLSKNECVSIVYMHIEWCGIRYCFCVPLRSTSTNSNERLCADTRIPLY